jgi:hypothetical protein
MSGRGDTRRAEWPAPGTLFPMLWIVGALIAQHHGQKVWLQVAATAARGNSWRTFGASVSWVKEPQPGRGLAGARS